MQQKAMQMMQAGDTAGAMRLQRDFASKQLGIDPKADTAKAVQTCGKPPTKPAWLAQADADADRADTLNVRMRDLEEKASSESVRLSGVSADKFTAARERIARWWGQQQDDDPSRGFAEGEVKILKSHRDQIAKLEDIL